MNSLLKSSISKNGSTNGQTAKTISNEEIINELANGHPGMEKINGSANGHSSEKKNGSVNGYPKNGTTNGSTSNGSSNGHSASNGLAGSSNGHSASSGLAGSSNGHSASNGLAGSSNGHSASSGLAGSSNGHSASNGHAGSSNGHSASNGHAGSSNGKATNSDTKVFDSDEEEKKATKENGIDKHIHSNGTVRKVRILCQTFNVSENIFYLQNLNKKKQYCRNYRESHNGRYCKSLVTEAARYAGRLKIPCGRRPQALRDRLCASITHIETATGTCHLNNFNP